MSMFVSSLELRSKNAFSLFFCKKVRVFDENELIFEGNLSSGENLLINTNFSNFKLEIDQNVVKAFDLKNGTNVFAYDSYSIFINSQIEKNIDINVFTDEELDNIQTTEKNELAFYGIQSNLNVEIEKAYAQKNFHAFYKDLFFKQKGLQEIKINRQNVLNDSIKVFLTNNINFFNFKIVFEEEIGLDQKGLKREWFYLVNEEIKQSKFLVHDNKLRYDINREDECNFIFVPDKNVDFTALKQEIVEENEQFLFFLGIFIVLSLFYKEPMHVNFTLGFYENLLEREFKRMHINNDTMSLNEMEVKDYLKAYFRYAQYYCVKLGFLSVLENIIGIEEEACPDCTVYDLFCKTFDFVDLSYLLNVFKLDKCLFKKSLAFSKNTK